MGIGTTGAHVYHYQTLLKAKQGQDYNLEAGLLDKLRKPRQQHLLMALAGGGDIASSAQGSGQGSMLS